MFAVRSRSPLSAKASHQAPDLLWRVYRNLWNNPNDTGNRVPNTRPAWVHPSRTGIAVVECIAWVVTRLPTTGMSERLGAPATTVAREKLPGRPRRIPYIQ